MLALVNWMEIPSGIWPAVVCVSFFVMLLAYFWRSHKGMRSFYFDPQDFHHFENGGGRELPVAASETTFESLLANYIGVMKLLITVAAASIAFGGKSDGEIGTSYAKIILAFSILYGVIFCGLLQFFYDEYCQNVRAYTRFRYSIIEALGFSSLTCFVVGYLVWAFSLKS